MKRFHLLASILALGAGATAMLPVGRVTPPLVVENSPLTDIGRLNSGAFRDGLYLGKFTAERGRGRRVVSGRWATAENRALFAAGYEQGYSEFVASHTATATTKGE